MKARASAPCAAVLCALTACGGAPSPPAPALTLRASVDGGAPVSVTAPFALNLPTNVVTISPGTQAMQQTVTSIKNGGQCAATAVAGNSTAALAIFALPPP